MRDIPLPAAVRVLINVRIFESSLREDAARHKAILLFEWPNVSGKAPVPLVIAMKVKRRGIAETVYNFPASFFLNYDNTAPEVRALKRQILDALRIP